MERRLKIASWVLVGLLLLPLFQHTTDLFHERKLKGAIRISEVPVLSRKAWFSGEFQKKFEPALKDRFGFRAFFIRINNQLAFSFYRKALANGVSIGEKNHLYELNYMLARNGQDFIGDSIIESNTQKLKGIQDFFAKQDKLFFVTFAAGKGSFYPEYFPDKYKLDNPTQTNIEVYSEKFDQFGVNYIDFNKWFVEMKDTSKYSLYPRTGMHWSYYGMVLTFDSLVNYIHHETGKQLTGFEWGNIKESRKYQSSDRDIEEAMNIIFRISRDKLAYPKINFVDKDTSKPKGVVIADSFYWGLHNMGFSHRIFDEGEYWYYNKQIIANHIQGDAYLDDLDRLERLKDVDVIMMMATEATMMKFPFGFEKILAD